MFSSGWGNNFRIRRGGKNFSSASIFDLLFKQPFLVNLWSENEVCGALNSRSPNFDYVAFLTSQRSTLFTSLSKYTCSRRSAVAIAGLYDLCYKINPHTIKWFCCRHFSRRTLQNRSRIAQGSTYADMLFQKRVDTIPGYWTLEHSK
jgi:hypothetical protein